VQSEEATALPSLTILRLEMIKDALDALLFTSPDPNTELPANSLLLGGVPLLLQEEVPPQEQAPALREPRPEREGQPLPPEPGALE
jgi:hypothetical protein